MSDERIIQDIEEMSQRIGRDSNRLSKCLDVLSKETYTDDYDGYHKRLLDIDAIIADVSATISFLGVVITKLYTGEYSQHAFEMAKNAPSKSEFSNQAYALMNYLRTTTFLLTERSKIARTVFEYKVLDIQKSVENEV